MSRVELRNNELTSPLNRRANGAHNRLWRFCRPCCCYRRYYLSWSSYVETTQWIIVMCKTVRRPVRSIQGLYSVLWSVALVVVIAAAPLKTLLRTVYGRLFLRNANTNDGTGYTYVYPVPSLRLLVTTASLSLSPIMLETGYCWQNNHWNCWGWRDCVC